QRPRGQVVEHEVPPEDVVGVDPQLLGDEGHEAAPVLGRCAAGRLDTPDGGEVGLGVHLQPGGVDLAVEVDGELRDGADGPVDPQQPDHGAAAVAADRHPPRQAQVAVEPAGEQGPAVDLDPELARARPHEVGLGLDAQVGAVGVGADDPEAVVGLVPRARDPGDERPAPDDEPPARLARPRRVLGQPGEARLGEPGGGRGAGVVRRRGGVAERQQPAGGVEVDGARGHGRTTLAATSREPTSPIADLAAAGPAPQDSPVAGLPRVDLVIVHRDKPDAVLRTVERFLAQSLVPRIAVVDNGSPAATLDRLRAELPAGVELIEAGSNTGFGPAANIGFRWFLRHDPAPWLAVCPHDAHPLPGCLERLVAVAGAQERAGLASADVGDALTPVIDRYFGAIPAPATVTDGWEPAGYPHGTLMLARRECLESVGLFDERYFAYCEEAELAIRAKRAGWQVGVVRGA